MISAYKTAALVLTAAIVASGPASAQYYSSVQQSPPPLYPYMQQPRAAQPYAIEVAPGTYVIRRPGEARAPVHRHRAHRREAVAKSHAKPLRARNDPRLIEELRQRSSIKSNAINTTRVVRLKPKVVETTRYVDDPPRVVERYTVVDDSNGEKKVVVQTPALDKPKAGKNENAKNEKRVIQADAEITVLGPDRMTIQLYRKGERGKPGARLN